MIRGPAGRCRVDAIEPEVAEFQRIDEHIDRANRITLVDPIIQAFRQQRRLPAIRPLNETLHHFPRRFSKGIIASMGFSHSLGVQLTPIAVRGAGDLDNAFEAITQARADALYVVSSRQTVAALPRTVGCVPRNTSLLT